MINLWKPFYVAMPWIELSSGLAMLFTPSMLGALIGLAMMAFAVRNLLMRIK